MLSIIPLFARSWRDGADGIELASLTTLLIMPYAQLLAVGTHVPFAFLVLLLWFGVLYRRFQKERPAQPAVAAQGGIRGPAGSAGLPAAG
jgi:hypothetical protein